MRMDRRAGLLLLPNKVLSYYGTGENLSVARASMASATIGNYVLFAGGFPESDAVDAYSSTLAHSTPTTALSSARQGLGGAANSGYAFFAGGSSSSNRTNAVDTYNSSLAHGTPSSPLTTSRSRPSGGSVGVYAVFAGGFVGSNTATNSVNAYNTSATRSTPTALSTARDYLGAANVGIYLLFAGGTTGSSSAYSAKVDAYNSSLAKATAPADLSVARREVAGGTTKTYAVFAGGYGGSTSAVDAYGPNLAKYTGTILTLYSSGRGGSASVGGSVIFGLFSQSSKRTTAYDKALLRYDPGDVSVAGFLGTGGAVGNYAILAGGQATSSDYSNIVEIYQLS